MIQFYIIFSLFSTLSPIEKVVYLNQIESEISDYYLLQKGIDSLDSYYFEFDGDNLTDTLEFKSLHFEIEKPFNKWAEKNNFHQIIDSNKIYSSFINQDDLSIYHFTQKKGPLEIIKSRRIFNDSCKLIENSFIQYYYNSNSVITLHKDMDDEWRTEYEACKSLNELFKCETYNTVNYYDKLFSYYSLENELYLKYNDSTYIFYCFNGDTITIKRYSDFYKKLLSIKTIILEKDLIVNELFINLREYEPVRFLEEISCDPLRFINYIYEINFNKAKAMRPDIIRRIYFCQYSETYIPFSSFQANYNESFKYHYKD